MNLMTISPVIVLYSKWQMKICHWPSGNRFKVCLQSLPSHFIRGWNSPTIRNSSSRDLQTNPASTLRQCYSSLICVLRLNTYIYLVVTLIYLLFWLFSCNFFSFLTIFWERRKRWMEGRGVEEKKKYRRIYLSPVLRISQTFTVIMIICHSEWVGTESQRRDV